MRRTITVPLTALALLLGLAACSSAPAAEAGGGVDVGPDERAFWAAELRRVHDYWSQA